ncbi:hypothetical protein [Mycetohabitans endofungorum]|uniref:hypothetical protein n=1 Tax=Mycetohabitans endofungorum TaxID=417203 RepID=UPI002B056678|nr:hypothetical protein [Mycetohabitans endofungorum]
MNFSFLQRFLPAPGMRTAEGGMIGNQIRRGPERDTTTPISALSRTVANNRIGQQYA